MRLADGALYRAKRSGRNRCVVYSSFVDAPLSLQEEAERARTAGLANTVYALARAVDLKDGYTHQHSARVAQYAAVLARELGHVARRRSTRSGPRASSTTSARSAWPTPCCSSPRG